MLFRVFRFTPVFLRALLTTLIFSNISFKNFEKFHFPQTEFNSNYCKQHRSEIKFLPGFLQVLSIIAVFLSAVLDIFQLFHLLNFYNKFKWCIWIFMLLIGFLRVFSDFIVPLKSSKNFAWAVPLATNCFQFTLL